MEKYLFVEKIHVHEGIASGTILQAAFLFTKTHIYKMPLESIGSHGLSMTNTSYLNTEALLNDVFEKIEKEGLESVEAFLKAEIPKEWVYQVSDLEKLEIQVGFWVFGKVKIKGNGEPTMVLNLQPKAKRETLKELYSL